MKTIIHNLVLTLTFSLFTQLAIADVSGNWSFAVTLGGAGSGVAEIVMTQEDEGEISGSYSGQLATGAIAGSHEGDNFEFAISNESIGVEIVYRGELEDDGTVKGFVLVQGQSMGSFTGTRK